ncbi:MAG: DUF4255 domain-containing protein [Spirosomataceae bacterium]
MVFDALDFLRNQLANSQLAPVGFINNVAVRNIQREGEPVNNAADNNVYVTLVNIEEEKHLRGQAPHYHFQSADQYLLLNPMLNLNLYVLFSAYCAQYTEALKCIQYVIRFFQSRNVFENIPNVNNPTIEKLMLELQSQTLDQNASMWQQLGGRYVPSVLYKARLVSILEIPNNADSGTVVTEIGMNIQIKP